MISEVQVTLGERPNLSDGVYLSLKSKGKIHGKKSVPSSFMLDIENSDYSVQTNEVWLFMESNSLETHQVDAFHDLLVTSVGLCIAIVWHEVH